MPAGAKILKLNYVDNCLYLYAEITVLDSKLALEKRRFITYGTGHTHLENQDHFYIDTYFSTAFVFHVYEIKEKTTKL